MSTSPTIRKRSHWHYLAAISAAILQSWHCLAGEQPYHREFRAATFGKPTPFRITSASLVDTNNCSPSRRKPVSLSPGALAGARPGMSMDEIVSLWGKPITSGLSCTGRPTFGYDDLWLDFEDNQLHSITLNVWMPFTPQFAGGLVPLSRKGHWILVLGEPTSQHTNASRLSLCYETNGTVMTLSFDLEEKQLSTVSLNRQTKAPNGTANGQR